MSFCYGCCTHVEAIVGFDPNDPTSLPGSTPNHLADIKKGMKGLKIVVDHEYISKGVSSPLANSIEAAVRKMEELGATIVSFPSPGNELENSDMWFKIAYKGGLRST